MKEYDFIFVLPGHVPISYPAGGYDVVYRLAAELSRSGYSVGFLIHPNLNGFLAKTLNEHRFRKIGKFHFRVLYGIANRLFSHKLPRNSIAPILRRLAGVDYNYRKLLGVDVIDARSMAKTGVKSRTIIATAWQTAFLVEQISRKCEMTPYYLIQHSEDDKSYAGYFAEYARKTYDLDLQKIVTNKKVRERFLSDNPLLVNVGFDHETHHLKNPIEMRNKLSILIPFRKGGSKGAKFALDAAKLLISTHKEIHIVGYGDYPKSVIPNWIEYHLKPSSAKLSMLYNSSSIFVLPSLVEGMSLATLEAMNTGCAVVATDNDGTNEYVVNGSNGLIVPPGDPKAIADAVTRLLENDELRLSCARNALETAKGLGESTIAEKLLMDIEIKEEPLGMHTVMKPLTL